MLVSKDLEISKLRAKLGKPNKKGQGQQSTDINQLEANLDNTELDDSSDDEGDKQNSSNTSPSKQK